MKTYFLSLTLVAGLNVIPFAAHSCTATEAQQDVVQTIMKEPDFSNIQASTDTLTQNNVISSHTVHYSYNINGNGFKFGVIGEDIYNADCKRIHRNLHTVVPVSKP